MIEAELLIINKLGLHARAAAKLVTLTSKYESNIQLTYNNRSINAKSIMGVMMLAAAKGSELMLTINGTDESAAHIAIEALIADRFEEAE